MQSLGPVVLHYTWLEKLTKGKKLVGPILKFRRKSSVVVLSLGPVVLHYTWLEKLARGKKLIGPILKFRRKSSVVNTVPGACTL
jgi:hypothetical protein